MKILSWNCQGLSKPRAIRTLRLILKDCKPDLIFISEVKTLFSTSISKALSSYSLSNHSFVPPIGLAVGLVMAWTNNINLTISLLNSTFIHAQITHDPNSPTWFLTAVHCPSNPIKKCQFWNSITNLNIRDSEPWLLIGDFNSVLSQAEKRGGIPFASSSNNSFSNELNNLGLIDLGFNGYPFTWSNKQTDLANIQERLDRGVGNSDWLSLFPHASILHLPAISSDHSPILLNTSITVSQPKPFRFENMWLDDFSCYNVVHSGWNNAVSGSPSYKLHSRIKNVKSALKTWNSDHFGNCHSKIKDLKNHIPDVQSLDKTANNFAIDSALQVELDIWLQRLGTFWSQKSKEKWLKDGE